MPTARDRARWKMLRALRRVGIRRPAPHALARLVFAFGTSRPTAFFVQVGSNDGRHHGDPLFDEISHRPWSGIMIEPVPYIFRELERNHGSNPRIRLEAAALADHDGTQPFFFIPETDDDALPSWYRGLGSFRKDVILGHRDAIPDIGQRIETIDVPCLTFDSLCRRHRVTTIDLVHIDTEGYDFEIIKLIDLDRLRPTVVLFERFHMDDATHAACLAHLRAHGYEHISNAMDTMCLRVGDLGVRDWRLRLLWWRLRARPSRDVDRAVAAAVVQAA